MARVEAYPAWKFYPSSAEPPVWVGALVEAFRGAQQELDSRSHSGLSSDVALSRLRKSLVQLGFNVESGKKKADLIRRPVLYGEQGNSVVAYEVDGFHAELGIVLEVEAGRGAVNNADYRDVVRASLMVDARYLVLAMMLSYAGGGTIVRSYQNARDRLDAIYASSRLKLPLEGVLLIGY